MKELRVIIAGSRGFHDYNFLSVLVSQVISDVTRRENVEQVAIVSGTARGADQLGELYAERNGLYVYRFPAHWDEFGKKAGYLRNADMAKFSVLDGNVGVLVAFWDGKSKGTKHMIDSAQKYGLEVHAVKYQ